MRSFPCRIIAYNSILACRCGLFFLAAVPLTENEQPIHALAALPWILCRKVCRSGRCSFNQIDLCGVIIPRTRVASQLPFSMTSPDNYNLTQ